MARLLCEAAELARDRRRKCPLRVSHSIARADGILAFGKVRGCAHRSRAEARLAGRSEEHTSELQSRLHLVCRLLLEKKKKDLRRRAKLGAHVADHPPAGRADGRGARA